MTSVSKKFTAMLTKNTEQRVGGVLVDTIFWKWMEGHANIGTEQGYDQDNKETEKFLGTMSTVFDQTF